MSVAEALAAGVPVVATETCPWALLAREGCGAWVPQQPSAIAQAVLAIVGDRVSARAMGERARALARREFSWPAMAARLSAEYQAAVARARRPVLASAAERHAPHA
jgi:glycosyltransferase involved in cell wall biosynthesis